VQELSAGEPLGELASAGGHGSGSELVVKSGAKQAVVLAVVALLMVLIGVSLLTSRQPSENVALEPEEEAAATASTSTVVTTVPVATSITVPASDTAVPSTTGVDTSEPPPNVNVNRLPELEAAYLAVYGRGEVQFLDLATGEWRAVQLESDVREARTIDEGLILTLPSGAIVFASPTNIKFQRYPEEEQSLVVDVSRDLIIFGTQTRPQSVRARTTDGTVQWTTQLPESAQAVGLLDDGRLVLQVEQWVALMEVASGEVSMLGAGHVFGVFGDDILMTACTDDLACGLDQLNAVTGERRRIVDGLIGLVSRVGDDVVIYRSDRSSVVRIGRSQGVIGVIAEGGDRCPPDLRTRDAVGVLVHACRDGIAFFNTSGRRVFEIPVPFSRCCEGIVLFGQRASEPVDTSS